MAKIVYNSRSNIGDRLSQKLVIFDVLEASNGDLVEEKPDYFRFQDPLAFKNIINEFGHLIQRLTIRDTKKGYNYPIGLDDIYRLIGKQCSETLAELNLDNTAKRFFYSIEKTFKNLTKLSLNLEKNEEFYLPNNLFPMMNHLDLTYVNQLILPEFDENLIIPQMKELSLSDLDEHSEEDESIRLIKANPQITQLSLKYVSEKLLKVVENQLLNLKKLKLFHYKQFEEIQSFDFTHLQSFILAGQDFPKFAYLSNNLTEFVADRFPNDVYYRRFILQNKNLKKLGFVWNDLPLNYEDIFDITNAQLNVVDMDLHCSSFTAKMIIDLIKNTIHLERLHLYHAATLGLKKKHIILFKALSDKWNVKRNGAHFTLTKKQL